MTHNIIVKEEDILNVKSGIILHGCNAMGVMNSGVAGALRAKYPSIYDDYKLAEKEYGLRLGQVIISRISETLQIANCITQLNYGRDKHTVYANYDAIALCLRQVVEHVSKYKNLTISYPLIGCGLANGDWSIVSSIIKTEFNNIDSSYLYLKK